jgi:hypothetical protein
MSGQIILAVAAALTSLIVSVVTAAVAYGSNRRIAQLEDRLTEARSERAAWRDYVYEARKRLYSDFQPVLFQMVERCDGALNRIRDGMAAGAREKRILWPSRLGEGWINDPYHMISTTWDLLTPLAFFRIGQQKLTGLDLSVDPVIRWQYRLAKELYATWALGNELAAQEPALPYNDEEPAQRQHLLTGHLENVIDCLIRADESGRLSCIRFGEFYDTFQRMDPELDESLIYMTYPLTNFHPQRKPVLWRVLITQAHLYMAIIKTFEGSHDGDPHLIHPVDALTPDDWNAFDWRSDDLVSREEAVVIPFQAVRRFLAQRLPRHRSE